MTRFDIALRERIERHLGDFERIPSQRSDLRRAAVALVVLPDETGEACFVLTRRALKLRRHGGQWALPGGRCDDGETSIQAALRELSEEVGLTVDTRDVLGLLDDYETRSGFVITPAIVWGRSDMVLDPDPAEVAEAYRVPLRALDAPEVPRLRAIPESDRPVISIPLLGTHIHAPTAAVIYQLREVAVWGRATRVAHFEQPVFAWR